MLLQPKQLPLLHNARNNLIRGLMRRGTPESQKQALEHANLSAGLQPDVAEMQYQLGVVLMQMKVQPPEAPTATIVMLVMALHIAVANVLMGVMVMRWMSRMMAMMRMMMLMARYVRLRPRAMTMPVTILMAHAD